MDERDGGQDMQSRAEWIEEQLKNVTQAPTKEEIRQFAQMARDMLTDKEFGAMNDIMAVTNTKGMTWDEALLDTRAKAAANPQVGGKVTGGGAKRAPLVYQLSNPDNIASVAQKAARDLIGHIDAVHAAVIE